jgi:hypothetical protein
MASSPAIPAPELVIALLGDTLAELVAARGQLPLGAPEAIRPALDAVLAKPSSLRDGLLVLLAYSVAAGEPIDFRTEPLFKGGRRVAQYLADELLPSLNIAGKKDALQTGWKGLNRYIDRSTPESQAVLGWAADQTDPEVVEEAFRYLASGMAATARDLPPMPELDTPKLVSPAVFAVLDARLAQPSGGSHEQFFFAGLLAAYLDQLDEPGVVETKNINASDASAGTAADVQHRHRGQVISAYEVTANDWRSKIGQASATLRAHDLRHVTILATGVATVSGADLAAELPPDQDVIVLDLREEIRSLVGRLDKPHRREGLRRIYTHLVERQSNDALVRGWVDAIVAAGLVLE